MSAEGNVFLQIDAVEKGEKLSTSNIPETYMLANACQTGSTWCSRIVTEWLARTSNYEYFESFCKLWIVQI